MESVVENIFWKSVFENTNWYLKDIQYQPLQFPLQKYVGNITQHFLA